MTLPQSGRLDGGEQPQGLPDARAQPSSSLPCWASSCSWLRREWRMGSSSHPTVETAYPLAQQVAPLPWRWRPPYG